MEFKYLALKRVLKIPDPVFSHCIMNMSQPKPLIENYNMYGLIIFMKPIGLGEGKTVSQQTGSTDRAQHRQGVACKQ